MDSAKQEFQAFERDGWNVVASERPLSTKSR